AASAALALSDIPFNGPVGAVRVGRVNDQFVINPTYAERRESAINITVVGTSDGIVMIESGAKEIEESIIVDAIEFGHAEIKKIVAAINDLVSRAGKQKRAVTVPEFDTAYYEALDAKIGGRLKDALDTHAHPKTESYALVKQIKDELAKEIPEGETAAAGKKKLATYYETLRERTFREQVAKERIRPDRRAFDQIRPITIEVGVLPRTHGSALFTRGETQALVTATLGTSDDSQRLESYEGEQKKRFMLHYNFPPFSVGETGRMTGVGRREVGHGALAERAISAVLPGEEESPYVPRVVSDILESNGSSSMATVCGASLALMDAGIPLKGAVAGIAMGLVKEGDDYAILTDIAGAEDHYGDMDFKVAGTRKGITALQMDIKIKGLARETMAQALAQAKEARLFILDKIAEVIPAPRSEMSRWAPRITTLQINPDKIRDIIGPGGKVIRKIVEETGAQIDVEDDGRVFVASADQEGAQKAIDWIKSLTDEVEVGRIYNGKVVRTMPTLGAFVEILPNQDGLVHISKLTDHRVGRTEEVVNEGDRIVVKAVEVDSQGRLNLSRQAAIEELTAKGEPIVEEIDMDKVAEALTLPPPEYSSRPPRRNGAGRR
ncbi:MAG: polyribonucleotide nucleotidyltransferase, partial [Candidatus Dormibacteraceae bacterium]